MQLIISIGKHRFEKRWQVKQYDWPFFVKRLSRTIRTHETVAEYMSATVDRQTEIKDKGGFVGGRLAGHRRLKGSVLSRCLITLDADYAGKRFWAKFGVCFPDVAACCYSTHKHTADAPRLRLIIPLDREVLCDEYIAICRKIADEIGINDFDHTGYQPSRLMYWPSTPKDGDFYFREQKGEFLSADEVLGRYADWTNISEWPVGENEKLVIDRDGKKQGEPTEKKGLIGLFCRSYTISEAVDKFLSDVYVPCAIEGRYTYSGGSTAAGVVVYDDKFSFSHHSTDPASEVLCNAFDLVRLHKFSELDEGFDEDKPMTDRPSYKAMCELAGEDKKVRKQKGRETVEDSKRAFDEIEDVEEDEEDEEDEDESEEDREQRGVSEKEGRVRKKKKEKDWLSRMDIDNKGKYQSTLNNVALILQYDKHFEDCFYYNEFVYAICVKRSLPWRKIEEAETLIDADIANLEDYIERIYKFNVNGKVIKGLLIVGEKQRFHPVRDYLEGLVWDGKKRLDNVFCKYLGAESSDYVKAVCRKGFVAAVARVFEPGIKYDTVPLLMGEEGIGKSTLLDKMGGVWFSDTFNLGMLNNKEGYEQLQGVWLVEMSELSGMAKAEVERVKGFISSRRDNYRAAYEKFPVRRPRQSTFWAGTNLDDPLKSQTGNRRFWPVKCNVQPRRKHPSTIDEEMRGQLWAEAVHYYREGEPLFLSDELEIVAKAHQDEATEQEGLLEKIEDFLSKPIPKNWYDLKLLEKKEHIDNYADYTVKQRKDFVERTKVCIEEIFDLVMNERRSIYASDRRKIKQQMNKIKGWKKMEEPMRFGNYYPRQRGGYEKFE